MSQQLSDQEEWRNQHMLCGHRQKWSPVEQLIGDLICQVVQALVYLTFVSGFSLEIRKTTFKTQHQLSKDRSRV